MSELKDGEVIPLALLTRRTFCRMSLTGLGLAVLPSCGGDPLERVGTGALSDPGTTPNGEDPAPEDMAVAHGGGPGPADMATSHGGGPGPADMAHAGSMSNCPGGVADTGTKPASIAMNTAVYVRAQAAFLCHDAGGYFALSSSCTHSGATLSNFNGTSFHCNRHGANFSYTGSVQNGPSGGPLDHFLLCLTANGTIGIANRSIVGAAQRFVF